MGRANSVSVRRNTPPHTPTPLPKPPRSLSRRSLWHACVCFCVCVSRWQQRLWDLRGPLLEAGRPSDVHQGSALARRGVCTAPGEPHQTHVKQHDRELRQAVCLCVWGQRNMQVMNAENECSANVLYNSVDKYFTSVAALGWHLSPSWRRAASRQIFAFPQHCAPCSTWWWMPRTSLLNYVRWRWAKRYKHDGWLHV